MESRSGLHDISGAPSFVLLVLPLLHGQLAFGPVHRIVGLKQQEFQATVLSRLHRHEAEFEIGDADQALS